MLIPDLTMSSRNSKIVGLYKKCKDVWAGTVYAQRYLEKSVSESTIEFTTRQENAAAGVTFRRGINSIVDIVFRKPITYSENIPENILEYYRTVDGERRLNQVMKDLLRESLLGNKVYLLVWTPKNTAINAKEEKELGIRPYVEIITRDRVLDNVMTTDAYGKLSRIALEGSYVQSINKYRDESRKEWRVYFSNGVVEIWREAGDKKNEVELTGTLTSTIQEMHVMELDYSKVVDIPPFINEANLQILANNTHSNKYSYNKKLAFPFIKSWGMLQNSRNIVKDSFDDQGNPVKVVEFQASKGIDFPVNPETGAKLGDVVIEELDGKADAVLKGSIADLKKEIAEGFLKMFESSEGGNKTVEQSESERAAGEGMAANIAQNMEDFLEEFHKLFCKMAGETPQGKITMNKDFIKEILTDLRYKMLTDLRLDNVLDSKAYIEELQKYGELDTVDADAVSEANITKGVM